VIVVLLIVLLMAIGFGLAKLVALPFGGVGTFAGALLGIVIIVVLLALLALFGRRRQAKAQAKAREAAQARASSVKR
jgi:hypothetical protein